MASPSSWFSRNIFHMAQNNPSLSTLAGITSFGRANPGQLDFGTPAPADSPAISVKKAGLAQASAMKQATMGSPEFQRTVATAARQGNDLGQAEFAQDLYNLSNTEMALKYGQEAVDNRHQFAEAHRQVGELKTAQRTNGEVAADAGIDFGLMAANTLGGIANFGAAGVDAVTGSSISPEISRGLNWLNEQGNAARSDLAQDRRVQHAIEGSLNQADSADQYERDIAAGKTITGATLGEIGRNFADGVENYSDDPIMMGALVPEGVGSLLPATAAIRVVGKATAMKTLMSGGMSKAAATTHLKTAAGRQLLEQHAVKAAPLVMGATESGAAVSQTQQEILTMSEEELGESPTYTQMRTEGLSHEDAQTAMAREAGIVAGAAAVPGAVIAGKIAAPFAANPLSPGAASRKMGSSAVGATRNLVSEGIEETIQEGNAQISANIGERSAGLNTGVLDGVGEAAAEGLVGGLATAGPLQAPGAVLGTAGETVRTAGRGLEVAIEGRKKQVAASIDETSPVGDQARAETADKAVAAAETIIQELDQTTTDYTGTDDQPAPNQTKADQPTPEQVKSDQVVRDTVQKAVYLDPEDAEAYSGMFPEVAAAREANEEGLVARSVAVEAMSSLLTSEETDPTTKAAAAIEMMASLGDMRRTGSDEMTSAMEGLAEDSPALAAYADLKDRVSTLESSQAVSQASEIVKTLTPETVAQLVPQDDAETAARILTTVGELNPAAADVAQYDRVMNQLKHRPALLKSLKISRDIAAEFQAADETKAQIETDQIEVIEGMEPGLRDRLMERRHHTVDTVREDIMVDGNYENAMPSLTKHRRTVAEAIKAGQLTEAVDALSELNNFATHQSNKIDAYNRSAEEGRGKKKPFQAYGPYGWFADDQGVYVNAKAPNSVAMAREAWVDTNTAASLYNTMVDAYSDQLDMGDLPARIEAPELHSSIGPGPRANPVPAPSPVAEQVTEQVVTDDPLVLDTDQLVDTSEESQAPVVADSTPTEQVTAQVEEETDDVADIDDLVDVDDDFADPGVQGQEQPEVAPEPAPENDLVDLLEVDDTNQTEPQQVTPVQPAPVEDLGQDGVAEDTPEVDEQVSWFQQAKTKLATSEGGNRFLAAFKPRKNSASLVEHESPAKHVVDHISSLVSDKNGLDVELNSEQQKSVKALMEKAVPFYTKKLDGMISTALDDKGGRRRKMLDKGEDLLGFREMASMNLAEKGEDGEYRFNQAVAEASVMASLEWVMRSNARGKPFLDDEKISKMFGLGQNGGVTTEIRTFARSGVNIQNALSEIADTLQTMLGVTPDNKASVQQTQGILRSMAANVLEQMALSKGVTLYRMTIETKDGTPHDYTFIKAADNEAMQKLMAPLESMPDVFSRVFGEGHEAERYVGAAPKAIAKTQLKNRHALLSRLEKKVIKRLQDTPFQLNLPMTAFRDALGVDALKDLLGYVEIEEGTLNKAHEESIRGKNISIESGLKGVLGYENQAKDVAAAQGKELGQVPIFFGWKISRVGRLQQQGPVTPQGDKIVREMITATNGKVDLSDPEQRQNFYLAVAQAADISVEKNRHAQVIQEIEDRLDGELRPALTALHSWLGAESETPGTGMMKADRDRFVSALKDAEETPMSMKLLHALVQVAHAERAMDEGGTALTAFRTTLSLEADGKTDGPVNAMVHMTTGQFTPHQIKSLAKGGLFFGDEEVSLNEYISQRDGEDLYHVAAGMFRTRLVESFGELVGKEREHGEGLMRLMDEFLPDFVSNLDNGAFDPEIGRNITKNPLTVFLYGSGIGGISAKITSAMTTEIHKRLSEDPASFAANKSLVRDLARVLNISVSATGDFESAADKTTDIAKFFGEPKDAELSTHAKQNMTDAIQRFFGDPMGEAIDKATGGLAANMKLTQGASQVQALIFKDVFAKAVAEREADQDQPLSQADYEEVFEATMKVAPVYDTDAQTFHIAAGTKYSSNQKISSSLTENLSSNATLPEPSEASVKVSPYMTIGTGDGRMILNIYADGNVELDPSLPVFDGVELAIGNIKDGSRLINQATFKGWMDGNIYESLLDGWKHMMPHLDLDALSKETLKGIRQAFKLPKDAALNATTFRAMERKLQSLSNESAARKVAISKMHTWTDHMASAMAPHENKGIAVPEHQVVDKLNELYDTELKRIEAKQTKANQKPAVESPDLALVARIKRHGTPVDGTSAYMVKGEHLGAFVKAPAFQDALNQPGAMVYFGTPADLTQIRDEQYGHLPKAPIQLGQAFPGSKVIFIANQATETVVHEALHLQTGRQLIDFYDDPSAAPNHVKGAVTRLEKLRDEFLSLDLWSQPANVQDARDALTDALDKTAGNPADQMGEFISWVLSNQHLSDLAEKTKVSSRLAKITQSVLAALRSLLGIKSAPGTNILSNVRFNTAVLTASPQRIVEEAALETETVLNQEFGSDPRLTRLERRFIGRLQKHTEASRTTPNTPAEEQKRTMQTARARQLARDAAAFAQSNGFGLNFRQSQAFQAIHLALMSGMQMDPAVMSQLNKLYGHTIKSMTPDSFLEAAGINPENADDIESNHSTLRYAALTGDTGLRHTANGRSDLLATFMALALVDDDFRQVLRSLEAPKDLKIKADSVDGAVENAGDTVMNLITRFSISAQNQPRTIGAQLDLLGDALSEIEGERRFFTTLKKLNVMDKANDYLADKLDKGTKAAVQVIEKRRKGAKNRHVSGALGLAEMVVAFGSKDTSAAAGEALTTMANHSPRLHTIRALLNDLRGMTASNADLMRLINPVKAQIDALRQDYREGIPAHLASHFSRKLNRSEWTRLFMGLGRADLLALDRKDARELLADPGSVDARIQAEEEAITATTAYDLNYFAKAEALAEYMINREVTSSNLLRNATAIAHLYGESVGPDKVDAKLIASIDRLVSLYAYRKLDDPTKETLKNLAEKEANGIRMIVGYHDTTRVAETARAGSPVGINNGWKGYVPATQQEGVNVIVADDSEHDHLVQRGFTRIGAYTGDGAEGYRGKRSYYQSSVSARNAFRQGVAQTVHTTFQGVDARTGESKDSYTGGLVLGKAQRAAQRRIGAPKDGLKPAERLLPIFDGDGAVVAYERSLRPEKLAAVNFDMHLGRMLGAWSGRILEESEADNFNHALVQTLKKIHDEQGSDRADEFVNAADPKIDDPVVRDAWNTLGWQIKADARKVFGAKDYFPVRRDMLNDALGYRAASVTDPWTGISRLSEKSQKAMMDAATFIMGKDAFKYLSKSQGVVSDVVSYAKTTIIVRSVLVSTGNIMSNMLHLMMHGIDPITGAKGLRDKFVEITQYTKNREKILQLEADLAAEKRNPVERKKIQAQLTALEDANEGLSIKPLLDAGEFSTVSESLTEEDLAIREGKFTQYVEKATEKLPGWAQTAGKNILVTKDTALFRGLNRMVQYGDFVAKAVLYDHLKEKGELSQQEIMDVIAEEYVNYNRLPGRGRDFLESMGLLWFFNYKLRIMKIATKMVREKPLTALFYGGGVGAATDIQSVFDGSIAGAWWDDRLGYSVGPEMIENGFTLNPYWNITT